MARILSTVISFNGHGWATVEVRKLSIKEGETTIYDVLYKKLGHNLVLGRQIMRNGESCKETELVHDGDEIQILQTD